MNLLSGLAHDAIPLLLIFGALTIVVFRIPK